MKDNDTDKTTVPVRNNATFSSSAPSKDSTDVTPVDLPNSRTDTEPIAGLGKTHFQQHEPRSGKKRLFLFLAAFVIAVGAAIGLYFVVLQTQTSKPGDDPLAKATRFASPQALIDEATPYLKGKVMDIVAMNGIGASTSEGYNIYSPPAHRVEGANFSSLPLESSGSGFTGDSVMAEANYNRLESFFQDNKFKRIFQSKNETGAISQAASIEYISYAEYESASLLCAIRHGDASGTGLKSHVASVGCADRESYKIATDRLKDFYTAYTDEDTERKNNLTFGLVDQGKGINGYEYAVIYQQDRSQFKEDEENTNGAFTGYYLKQPSEKEWLLFASVQEGAGRIECSKFNDNVTKSAFNGFVCYDEKANKDSVVK